MKVHVCHLWQLRVLQLGIRASADKFWQRHTCTNALSHSSAQWLLGIVMLILIFPLYIDCDDWGVSEVDEHDKRNNMILILIMDMHDELHDIILYARIS